MKKVKKGDYGYIRYEKKKRLLTTVVLFLIPLVAFLAAFLITGTKKNIIIRHCHGRLPSGVPCSGEYDHDVAAETDGC